AVQPAAGREAGGGVRQQGGADRRRGRGEAVGRRPRPRGATDLGGDRAGVVETGRAGGPDAGRDQAEGGGGRGPPEAGRVPDRVGGADRGLVWSHIGVRHSPKRGAVVGIATRRNAGRPASTPAKNAASATSRAITPIVSRLSASNLTPARGIVP